MNNDNIIEEDYIAEDEEDIFEEEKNYGNILPTIASRIYEDNKPVLQWIPDRQIDICGSKSTLDESTLGKKMVRYLKSTRSEDDKFCDNVIMVCKNHQISYEIRDQVLKFINNPNVKDIGYKSAEGMVFGYIARNAIKSRNINEFNKIIKQLQEKEHKINDLDVIRYARYIDLLLS